MTATLATLRSDLRYELKDSDSGAYKWSDAELNIHIHRAVNEYSRASPREMKTTKATISGSRSIDISAMSGIDDLIKVLAVEFPTGKLPQQFQRFSLWNNAITLLGSEEGDGTNCHIYWGSVHVLADVGSPTCSIPEKDQETVLAGAAGYAALAWAAYAINRTNLGDEAKYYLTWGTSRLKTFGEELRRLRSKVRLRRMYPPAREEGSSQTSDRGP